MLQTRRLSIVGAAGMIFAIVVEGCRLAHAISLTEINLFSTPDFLFDVSRTYFLYFVVAGVFTGRIVMLSKPRPYWQVSASWFVACATGLLYVWIMDFRSAPNPECVSDGAKICFGIYTSTREDLVERYVFIMPVLSFLRSSVTYALAESSSDYK